ncbi:MAG: right-handed parallel beta-helix repeat-containing protein [Planctomycetota bacterium]|jgi:parallel beta-helix repeat protein
MKRSSFSRQLGGVLIVLLIGAVHAGEIRERAIVTGRLASVRDFGAVGDGQTDDAGAFQRALDSGRGDIFVPRGTYRFDRTVVAELDRAGPLSITGSGTATIIMAGPGPALKLVGTHEGTAAPSTVKENVWLNQRMPTVSGLEIIGADPDACGIEATGTMKATFSKLSIRKALHGIHLTKRNRNVIISDCHVYENRGIGIYLDDVDLHQINVGNSHVSYNAGGGVVQRAGNVRNLQIGNCDIEASMGQNTPATANVLIDATGGSIGEIAVTGCTLQHTHAAPDSANIRIIGESEARTYAQGERRGGNVTITGNILSDVQTNIHLRKVRGVTIVGNTVWKGYEHDLLIEDCSSVVIGSNVLDRNPRYHYGDGATANRGLVFRNCKQVTVTGLNINNVRRKEGAIVLEKCRDVNISGCIILDCDGCGILMDDVQDTVVSGCVVRDSREQADAAATLVIKKGKGNLIVGNLLAGKLDIAAGSAELANNLER